MNAINELLIPANWELTSPKEKLYSSDHVIDAYLKGKDDGLEQQQRLIFEKLVSNIEKAGRDTSRVWTLLKDNRFSPIGAYLRINSWDDFSMLIILHQSDFLDERMLGVYEHISEIENDVEEDMYHIQVAICDTEDQIDENYVRSDGFALKFKIA
jgi:hypothetical protein